MPSERDSELLQQIVRRIESGEVQLRSLLIEVGREVLDVAENLKTGAIAPEAAAEALVLTAGKIVDAVQPSAPKPADFDDE
ncbi:hypothetical protein PA01_12700 [Azoarcus sp. PA01]|nr:hypothetical protein PA01_12700 [Azoarcus sp. PA01]